ncbi:hypothetical protein D0C36_22950 [Mucilaginibacter conchicola]|uniref:Uncharacterized protein n=1 Tax=Mucilaginibacter conchicola TaxID=2303333 RepID=A0A372NPC9_9SPHI|nr:hypothetical protein [Mucilaginibacter conchicola]RFZ90103.1 hypothetical protein D0C36_22950 [Mucilaginibacter conchicola]
MKREKFIYNLNIAVTIFVLFLTWLCAAVLVCYYLIDYKKDTIAVSNVGFAAFLALASISFNWAKTFDSSDDQQADIIEKLNLAASKAIMAAICFVGASLAKYIVIKGNEIGHNIISDTEFLKVILYLGCVVTFNVAFSLAVDVITRLGVIYIRALQIFK